MKNIFKYLFFYNLQLQNKITFVKKLIYEFQMPFKK